MGYQNQRSTTLSSSHLGLQHEVDYAYHRQYANDKKRNSTSSRLHLLESKSMTPYTQVEICLLTNTVTLKQSNGYPVAQSKFDTKERALEVASIKIKEIVK